MTSTKNLIVLSLTVGSVGTLFLRNPFSTTYMHFYTSEKIPSVRNILPCWDVLEVLIISIIIPNLEGCLPIDDR